MSEKKEMDVGVQPVDEVLKQLELSNPDVVSISCEHLTHKQMQKSRMGRRVTRNIQMKILRAINSVLEEGETPYTLKQLFNYKA